MRPLGILMAGMLLFACSKDDTGGKADNPVIEVAEAQGMSLTADAGSAELHYTIKNATKAGSITAECAESWIELKNDGESGTIRFDYDENTDRETRQATILLTYPGADDVQVNVTQQGSEK